MGSLTTLYEQHQFGGSMVLEVLVEKIIEKILDKSLSFFNDAIFKGKSGNSQFQNDLHTGLKIQTNKSLNFSKNLPLFRTPDTRQTESCTIELMIRNQYRHFTNPSTSNNDITERDLLADEHNHIILGDPGSGKTTTIKRLIQRTFEILFSETSDDFPYSFPIIIRLGEIKRGDTLLTHFCKELGIGYETIENRIEYEEVQDVYDPEYKQVVVKMTKVIPEFKIGNLSIENAIGDYLNGIRAILFLDGLDEIHYELKDAVFDEIKRISNLVTEAKIIIASRYPSDIKTFKRFKKNEILPLSEEQSRDIAGFWVDNVNRFFNKLSLRPYKDLADRPLFLYLLIVLFNNNNEELPEQAIDIYRQIVLLVIKEWDEEREYKTSRYSKYKQFDTYKKEDFLSELAFQLMYKFNARKVFTEDQLENAYLQIYHRYPQLTGKDVEGVVEDIEAHNGLVVKSFGKQFEFSHLSLQEYLCAKFLLSIPFSKAHFDYLNIAPAPFAVANVLSPAPAEWFSMLFLHNIKEIGVARQLRGDKAYEFIDRLLVERVVFPRPCEELGFATLFLMSKFYKAKDMLAIIDKFVSNVKYVKESIMKALLKYDTFREGSEYIRLELKKGVDTDLYINVPASGCIKKQFYNALNMKSIR